MRRQETQMIREHLGRNKQMKKEELKNKVAMATENGKEQLLRHLDALSHSSPHFNKTIW